MAGYLRPSILWHLLRVGASDVAAMAEIIGAHKHSLNPVVRAMRNNGEIADRPYSSGQFELTEKGRLIASRVQEGEVETADQGEHLANLARTKARMQAAQALAGQLTDVVAYASGHQVGLEALLQAFEAAARVHTCCTQACANAAMQAAMRLSVAAASGRPSNAPIH